MLAPIKSRVPRLTHQPFKIVAAPRPDATLADLRRALDPPLGRRVYKAKDGTRNPDRPDAPRAG